MKKKEFYTFLHEILVKENNQDHIEKLKIMIRGNWSFNFRETTWISYLNNKCCRMVDNIFMLSCYEAVNKTWPFPEDKINEVLNDLKQCKE